MRKIYIMICVAWLLGGCSDFLEEYSQDLSRVENYTDLDETLLGDGYLLIGRAFVESSMYNLENNYFQVTHYMSDELVKYTQNNEEDIFNMQEEMFGWHTWQQEVGRGYDQSSVSAEDNDWNQAYHHINVCNMVLDAIDEQDADGEEQVRERDRIKGEAAFLRALYYFELVNLYGKPYCDANLSSPGVPVKLSPVVEDIEYVCGTVEEVYEQILTDLDLADTCLVNAQVKNHPYRADITAVYLLKSRVYLYMQNWEKALEYAQKTLAKNSGLLNLNTFNAGSGDVLSKSSPETIFSMGGHTLSSCIYNCREWNFGEWWNLPIYIISDDLVAAFDEGDNDLRSRYYICKDTIGGGYGGTPYVEAYTFRKVSGWVLDYKDVSDKFLFRTAEAYLNGAEAAALLGDEATARALLKTLRDNRLVNSPAISETGEALLTFIREERQRELCLEGHRWFDLRRYMVREQYPYTKRITHYYTEYEDSYGWTPVRTTAYTLEENDPAYTLALPREVLDFQPSLGVNDRPVRPRVDYTPEEGVEVTPPEEPHSAEWQMGYEQGYADGYAAGEHDLETGGFNAYYDDYDNTYEEDSDQYEGYDRGFNDGYNDAYYSY